MVILYYRKNKCVTPPHDTHSIAGSHVLYLSDKRTSQWVPFKIRIRVYFTSVKSKMGRFFVSEGHTKKMVSGHSKTSLTALYNANFKNIEISLTKKKKKIERKCMIMHTSIN
uniref:Uncharacterized protein n=1 Tax=Sipha flava TaxID=143950 RepID=A0A2S2QMV9_9HEMI